MSDEAPVEVYSEREKYNEHGYKYYASRPCGFLREIVKLDPAEDRDLDEEEYETEECGERPGDLDVPVKTLVGRLVNETYAVKIANCLDVRKDASRYHEGQHVDSDEEGRADGEGDEHLLRNFRFLVQLNLNHGHLWIIIYLLIFLLIYLRLLFISLLLECVGHALFTSKI